MIEYNTEKLHEILEKAKKRELSLKYELTPEKQLVARPKPTQTLDPKDSMQDQLKKCLVDDLALALFAPTPQNRLNEPNQENQKKLKLAKAVVLEFELQFKPDTPRLIMAPKLKPTPSGTLGG